jgi:hypothetical protein
MELIIFIAVVVVAALLWSGYVKTKKAESESKIDSWIPGGPGKNPDQHPLARFNTDADADKPWPYGEKIAEGKIHVKSSDVAPGKSADDRVEATAPQCGCGRSPTGFCVGLHKLTAEEWAVSDQNPNKASVAEATAKNKAAAVAKVKKAPAKKTAAKPAVAKKPVAAKQAPAKKKST